MKKMIALLLVLIMALSLTACGGEDAPETTTGSDVPETTVGTPETTAPADVEGFCFTLEGVKLVPGTTYDASMLPEPDSVYQVPSCAIEGTDNVYSFEAVEITAFHDGTQEIIYAIAIVDPNVCTDEGLYLGDNVETVVNLYGEDYTENGTAMVYTRGNTMLSIIIQNGYVVDIEFSWIT